MDYHLTKQHSLNRGFPDFYEHRDRMRKQVKDKKKLHPIGGASTSLGASLATFLDYLKTPSRGRLVAPEREVARVSAVLKTFCLTKSTDDVSITVFLSQHKELSNTGSVMKVFSKSVKPAR